MSLNALAARTYARALVEASGAAAPKIADELDELCTSIDANPATWSSITAPELSEGVQRALVDSVSEGSNPMTRNLMRLLVDNGRLAELPEIAAELRRLVKIQLGQLDVTITTAVELPATLRTKLEERLSTTTGKQVSLHASVDPEIIGGLVVQHGDTLIDTSLRSRLDSLKLNLSRPHSRS